MNKKSTVLVVDDEFVNRAILKRILSDSYQVLEAADGARALEILEENEQEIAAVILDLIMPGVSGYGFLEYYSKSETLKDIPVVVSTGDESIENEARCLKLGAWDFIKKPYHAEVIRLRVRNAIERSDLYMLRRMRYREQFDSMTGIYLKDKFLKETKKMLDTCRTVQFAMVCFDIYKFHLFNTFFGMKEGDTLLINIAKAITAYAAEHGPMTYCHEGADVFCLCVPYEGRQKFIEILQMVRFRLSHYQLNYDLVPVFGIYLIEDYRLTVNDMLDYARLASKACKGNYMTNYAFYDKTMEESIVNEQRIVNSMTTALRKEEFLLYLQPKYNIQTMTVEGAEVLVRWQKDGQLISPSDFIPVFERNGFIMELDYYIWKHTCMLLRRWLDEGREPAPVSVNISRVSLYNPNLVKIICELVDHYRISPRLLQLELTESAYTSNPTAIHEAMDKLQQRGFSILMDDFGSGYSSLNVLKDISVDILKIDMKFMSKCDMPGRSENILASVIRMAKWLHMPVIAEGVEEESQVAFLKSIGCEYIQGFYFARPMPVKDYELLVFSGSGFERSIELTESEDTDSIWTSTSQMEILFSNMMQAVAIFEYAENHIEILRVNNAYYDMFGFGDLNIAKDDIFELVDEEYREEVRAAFRSVVKKQDVTECEYKRALSGGHHIWINIQLKYITQVGRKHVIYGTMSDVTLHKKVDSELQKYRAAMSRISANVQTILVVDDKESNRLSLRSMFEESYHILEAEHGQQALEVLKRTDYCIDLILLDTRMPVMDGAGFMAEHNADPVLAEIPVIAMVSSEEQSEQSELPAMGITDFITKPFAPDTTIRRVCNVLEASKKFGEMLRGYVTERDVISRDELTGLYACEEARKMMNYAITKSKGIQALLLLDVNDMAGINEGYGRPAADRVMKELAMWLVGYFRKSDIIARYRDDKFLIFVVNIPSVEFIIKRCCQLVTDVHPAVKDNAFVGFSIGIDVSHGQEEKTEEMIAHAEEALELAKKGGPNQYRLFGY